MRRSHAVALCLAAPLVLAPRCEDVDGDHFVDALDNCPAAANGNQLDRDGDQIGDACDDDALLRLLLVRVTTPDGGVTPEADAVAIVADVAAYYAEVSYGNLRFAGVARPDRPLDVVGPISVPLAYDGYNDAQIRALVDAALVQQGIARADYDQTIYVVPDRFGNRTPEGFTAGFAGGSYVWMRDGALARAGSVGHEIGHNLRPGLGHANLLACTGAEPYALDYAGCESREYLDPYDAMGWSELRGTLNAAFRETAGFFVPSNVREVTASGTYWLAPIEKPGTDVRALKLRRASGEWIYLEYRQPIGWDASPLEFVPGGDAGVQIRTTYFGGTTLIRPNGEFSLAPGETYDAQVFTITTLWSIPKATLIEVRFR